jgi:signal transduction histidine kinase
LIVLDHHSALVPGTTVPGTTVPGTAVSGAAVCRGAPAGRRRLGFARLVRAMPIGWRVGSFAVINTIVVIVLASMIWNSARMLGAAWDEVRGLRESDTLLTLLSGEAGRLQSLIYQHISEQRPETFAEILLLREAVLGTLKTRGSRDPLLSGAVPELTEHTERFLGSFGDLRVLQSAIARSHGDAVLGPAREMANFLAAVEAATASREALITPALAQARESFAAMLVAANKYYLSFAPEEAEGARAEVRRIEDAIQAMRARADNDAQLEAVDALQQHTVAVRNGLDAVADLLTKRMSLLRNGIDGNKVAMTAAIDGLSADMHRRERDAQARFDQSLLKMYREVIFATIICVTAMLTGSVVVAQSIGRPLKRLMGAMRAISLGGYDRPIVGTSARDEIGDMARIVEMFRENAIARNSAEADLRAAKEHAERALAELRATQQNLIQAEKLAALGGLVAGIAHEVNNPVGISLTVASSFARRCERFATEMKTPPLRRSSLDDFVAKSQAAAEQLVANLQRAGELIQSFKQVAVDRSHAEQREFDLAEATDQIIASLRPVLKRMPLTLIVDVPRGISMNSYPGSYGQVLTNLFLNAVVHAYPDGRSGTLMVAAQEAGCKDVEITVADDGAGMTDDVRMRAFDPFFTTRRNHGGTGLGLHVIFNIVTQSLGGRLAMDSAPGRGTTFRITIPKQATAAAATTD